MALEAFAFAVPSLTQTADDIAAVTGADRDFVATKVGVQSRQILAPGETGVALSAHACEKLFARHAGLRERIQLVVTVTQNPDQRIPHNSARLVTALGLPESVASFDISLGCSGYVYGLKIIEGFLRATGLEHGLLVTCDPYSRIMAAENKDTNCVFGDAAAATWVTAGASRCRVVATDFGSDGSGGDAIEIPAGGAARPLVSLLNEGVESYSRDELRLHMAGRAVFNFVMTRIPASMDACLAKAGLTHGDIDLYALHQGSRYMLDALARRAGVDSAKVLFNMDRYGNTVSSSIPLLLAEADAEGRLAGSRVLVSGFGVGLSWGTAILEFAA